MNVFHKVTLASLKMNRTRTIVTIIGIVLSTSLICAVTTSVASFLNYTRENIIYSNGSWHAAQECAAYEDYLQLSKNEEVAQVVYGQHLGYAEIGSLNEYKPYLFLYGIGEGFTELMPVHLTDGEYPDAADELLLPEHLAVNGGIQYKTGDTLTLAIGERILDGQPLRNKEPFYVYDQNGDTTPNDETLAVRETRTYTVVGFYERPAFEDYSEAGYTALTAAKADPDGAYGYDLYFTMKNPKDTYDFLMKNQQYRGETNDELLMLTGTFQLDGMIGVIYGLAAIFIALIMFGSVSLIYNAFSISVSERTKQFGLLSSVGATKKQLRRMVFFEGLAVSAIAIPLGVLVGIAGISVTLLLIGNKFSSIFESDLSMRICVSPLSIVIACVVALLTVLISAWIPSCRATRVTAVEAIRQSTDIRNEKKPIRTPKFVYKLFGLPGILAHKHYKRSKKKYRATVMSLFMSIVLFISASAFTDYLIAIADAGFDTYGYDLRFYQSEQDTEKMQPDDLLTLIRDDEYVDAAAYVRVQSIMTSVPADSLTKDAVEHFAHTTVEYDGIQKAELNTTVYYVDDGTFRDLLAEYALSEAEYMNPEAPLAIAVDGQRVFDPKTERYVMLDRLSSDSCTFSSNHVRQFEGYRFAGYAENAEGNPVCRYESREDPEQYLELSEEEATQEFYMKTGKRIYERPYFVGGDTELYLIYPMSLLDSVVPKDRKEYSHVFLIRSGEHTQCHSSLVKKFKENRLTAVNLTDYAAQAEQERNLITIVQVFSYGFIVLISLIAAANVFNTISTNISLRRREFAMLRSIGMSDRDFHRMMNYECLLYGTKALLLGLPVSFGVTVLIHKVMDSGFVTGFRVPWSAIGIAVLSVFTVVFATMLYAMSKVKQDNPIDALRNENL